MKNLILIYQDFYYIQYSTIFLYLIISGIIVSLILTLAYSFIKKTSYVEKLIPYECGFEPYEDTRNIFNVQFYLVALLFLIFDLESLYVYPVVVSLFQFNTLSVFVFLEFLLELAVGYIYIYRHILKHIV